jgi:hypothetical protein
MSAKKLAACTKGFRVSQVEVLATRCDVPLCISKELPINKVSSMALVGSQIHRSLSCVCTRLTEHLDSGSIHQPQVLRNMIAARAVGSRYARRCGGTFTPSSTCARRDKMFACMRPPQRPAKSGRQSWKREKYQLWVGRLHALLPRATHHVDRTKRWLLLR